MPELHGRGVHANVLASLQRQYPGHSVASLERAVNYNSGSVEASKRLISAVEVGDEDRCRPPPRSLLPADGWKTDFVPDPFDPPHDPDQIQALPSRQYQMGTEKNYFDELQHCLDKAVQAAQNRKNAAKIGGRARPRSAMVERPWLRRSAKNDDPPAEWRDTGSPCVLCRRKSTRAQQVLTTVAEGLCTACRAYYISLGAGDRPDLSWLRWEHDGIIPEPEPEPVSASSERRRASGAAQLAVRANKTGFRPGGVAGAAARRHQAAIQEARRLREESGITPTARKPTAGGRFARPKSATSSADKEQAAQTRAEVARFRAKAARQKREEQETERVARAERASTGRRKPAATAAKSGTRQLTSSSEEPTGKAKGRKGGTSRLVARGNKLENRYSGRQDNDTSRTKPTAEQPGGSSSTVPSPPLSPSTFSPELDINSSNEKLDKSGVTETEDKLQAAEEAAAAHAVATNPEAWESFRAIVSHHEGSPPPAKLASRHAAIPFEAIRGYLTSLGESEFAATRAAVDCFVPGASPTRGTPRGSHIEAALAAVDKSGGITFELFVGGYQSWQASREVHRNRAARLVQDMEDRSAVRSKGKLVKRIDALVKKLACEDNRADGRVSVHGGLQRMVGAISQAAFTDGLVSAQGHKEPDNSPSDMGMDPSMLSEVSRTAQKIGGDIGDGVSVAHTALADMLLDVFEGDPKTLASVENLLS